MKYLFVILSACSMIASSSGQQPLYRSKAYSIYPDRVVQDKMEAVAADAHRISSNYKSPANLYQSTQLSFKFSINGKDNEMASGTDHHFNALPGVNETPVIVFGQSSKEPSGGEAGTLSPGQALKIRVDMRPVLSAFQSQGFYTTFKGDKIYKDDFKGLYVAGNTLPMIWDFDNLHNRAELELKDPDGDGIYETTLLLNEQKNEKQIASDWRLSKDIAAFPQYASEQVLANAIYNMSLEEMIKAVEPDSTFRTGKEWSGVWTRDISYSIILSMAYLQPEVAKNSLRRKVNKKKRIIQDTGTGGAYPCSTDRIIWSVAAWEIYKATGDKSWLQEAYEIIQNTVEDDMQVAYDPVTGLVKGESSFLDWREQTYPKWMQPADIYESENLGTNAVHYQANTVLAQMAGLLGQSEKSARYQANASRIKTGINKHLWLKDKGYYAQYLYGRNYKIVSPRSEALGEALCVLFGIADDKQQASVIANTPITDYGITCIYPQIPDLPPYHNNAVWPFVQTYWALASAKAANERSVLESIAAIYRPAALFLTNKENFVADNGDFAGTVINSSNMLWSLSGNLALVHKLLFGIRFEADHLAFHPFVPAALKGDRQLTHFNYRGSVLDISMKGFGNSISEFLLDGKKISAAEVPAGLKGRHTVSIRLGDSISGDNTINKTVNRVAPATPFVELTMDTLNWPPVKGAKNYRVVKNGVQVTNTGQTVFTIGKKENAVYQVIAMDENGIESFASEPVSTIAKPADTLIYEAETIAPRADYKCKGFSGQGFIEISKQSNRMVNVSITVPEDGIYAIDCRYANGSGPVNTENKCAIRTLKMDGIQRGSLVFPQRGKEEWSNWGFSNSVQLSLKKGAHQISLSFEDFDDNMNGDVNQAMIDHFRLTKL